MAASRAVLCGHGKGVDLPAGGDHCVLEVGKYRRVTSAPPERGHRRPVKCNPKTSTARRARTCPGHHRGQHPA
jgi:hypothetical protein